MTDLKIGVVDVLVVRLTADGWRVLLLRRATGTRCTGAWEIVHGNIEPGERPWEAALRELGEETGLAARRLYNVTVHLFHLHQTDTVQVSVAFCAFVNPDEDKLRLGSEHDHQDWLTVNEAKARLFWPQDRRILADAYELLREGNAGAADDVLRVI